MIIDTNQQDIGAEPPVKRKRLNLLLHCGGRAVDRQLVEACQTPVATPTWQPIPHHELVQQVEQTVCANGLIIGEQAHSLSHDGNRYFGITEIRREGAAAQDYSWVMGIRNSHDKTYPAGLVCGAQVFVCDNLSFSGEVKMTRKHTLHIMRDLGHVVQQAVGRLSEMWHVQDGRIRAYRDAEITDIQTHDLIVKAVDVGACPNQALPKVLKAWRQPPHEDFQPRTVYSLFNAFTEASKGSSLDLLPRRSTALHGLLDNFVGLPS